MDTLTNLCPEMILILEMSIKCIYQFLSELVTMAAHNAGRPVPVTIRAVSNSSLIRITGTTIRPNRNRIRIVDAQLSNI